MSTLPANSVYSSPPPPDPHLSVAQINDKIAHGLPEKIGKFHVVERLGSGGMGVVYKCRQLELDRLVAIKVLSSHHHADEATLLRFQREARSAASLNHPNAVQIYDFGTDDGMPFLVMELVEGQPLDHIIGTPFLNIEITLRVVFHIAQALQAGHAQGILHRDVKPSNILIDRGGRPKLTDFGLAKPMAEQRLLSGVGDLIGTPRYMSPEQALCAPDELDARTDVYSLGVVMYEMLTGKPPVDGPNAMALLRNLVDGEPVPIQEQNPAIPLEVAHICMRAMAKDPNDRYPTAAAFAQAIQSYMLAKLFGSPEVEMLAHLPGKPQPFVKPDRRKKTVAGLAVFLSASLLAVFIWLFLKPNSPSSRTTKPPANEHWDRVDIGATLAAAKEQFLSLPSSGERHRERLQGILDDLTMILRQQPDHVEARLLRAKAFRRAGELSDCSADLDHLDKQPPEEWLLERVLARYQLHGLYLGNIAELVMRPPMPEELRLDLDALMLQKENGRQYLASLVRALANQEYTEAVAIVEGATDLGSTSLMRSDAAMLETDALLHGADLLLAEELKAEEAAKEPLRLRREKMVGRAIQLLRKALEADPNHLGLLFIKANSLQRAAVWLGCENDTRQQLTSRHRPAFDTALSRLRSSSPRSGTETTVARAVLLNNFGRIDPAFDQMNLALAERSTLPHLYAFRAWLHLHEPNEGSLTVGEIERILRGLEPAFDTPPESFTPYFVRALLQAAGGRWEESRRDLRQARRRLGRDVLPAQEDYFRDWFGSMEGPGTSFLNATVDVLSTLPTPVDIRLRLSSEFLKRLGDAELVKLEGLTEDDLKNKLAWGHFRHAKFCAEKDDRAEVIKHVRDALEVRLMDVNVKTFREDDSFKAWNNDDDFRKLYGEFEKQ